jgi:hypothetical protein
METEKLSERDMITLSITEENIKVIIRYPKTSRLTSRLKMVEKLKEGCCTEYEM